MKLLVTHIIQETSDTKTFILKPERKMVYEAGQFITLLFDDNGHEVRRSFSLSSAPAIDALPSVTIKRVANGLVSRQLLDTAKTDDEWHVTEPAGRFVLPKDDFPRDIFLIAAGSGITPIFGLLKQLLYTDNHARITLVYSNKSIESTIFYEQITQLQQAHAERLKVIFLWNNAKNLRMARLSNALLEELVAQHLHFKKEDALFYTCGPFYFMLMVQITLLSMRFDKNNIRKELYTIESKPPTPTQYAPQPLLLRFRGIDTTLHVAANQSILEAGLEAGLALPYNCRSGQCGACVALCERGKVEMAYNEVLTDEEVGLGQVLTCVGHPLTSDVRIVFTK